MLSGSTSELLVPEVGIDGWQCRTGINFTKTAHLYNTWNSNKPVKISRDGQVMLRIMRVASFVIKAVEPKTGAALVKLLDEHADRGDDRSGKGDAAADDGNGRSNKKRKRQRRGEGRDDRTSDTRGKRELGRNLASRLGDRPRKDDERAESKRRRQSPSSESTHGLKTSLFKPFLQEMIVMPPEMMTALAPAALPNANL